MLCASFVVQSSTRKDVFFLKIEESFPESQKQVRNRSETGQKQTIQTILRTLCFHRDCCLIFRFILHRNSGSKTRNSFTIIVKRVVVVLGVLVLLLVLVIAWPVVVVVVVAAVVVVVLQSEYCTRIHCIRIWGARFQEGLYIFSYTKHIVR